MSNDVLMLLFEGELFLVLQTFYLYHMKNNNKINMFFSLKLG
jgi:hypothetical protein